MIITTSKKSTKEIRQFARDLANSLPFSVYRPRARKQLSSFLEESLYRNTHLLVFEKEKTKPGKKQTYAVRLLKPTPLGFKDTKTLRLKTFIPRKDIVKNPRLIKKKSRDIFFRKNKTPKFFHFLKTERDADFILKNISGKKYSFFLALNDVEIEIGPCFEVL